MTKMMTTADTRGQVGLTEVTADTLGYVAKALVVDDVDEIPCCFKMTSATTADNPGWTREPFATAVEVPGWIEMAKTTSILN